ncbi:oxidoreductase [Novosphingobium sp. Leaf2]|uniref:oxidoreductase n=1 Tax=Novosphingobium sp. Leaf2 TaxID=1735670 RepID=UPI0006F60B46|nr:oxidoreductase [Novosphingobium sp. Leaf2]KQM20632.1 short-chain dehydrogenase [Novosphingobium sp. Leaf2]
MSNWFITGVSSGLGFAIARAAIDAGHCVVGTVRAHDAVGPFEALGEQAIGMVLDVTDSVAVQRVVSMAEGRTGGLDVVVNNAGAGYTGAIEETPIADAKALFDINVWGALAVIQAVLPGMRARRAGHIVNIGSVSGLACWNGTGIYGASKFALDCIGRTLAQEVNPLGINVTNVAPGGMRTQFAASRLPGAEPAITDYAQTAHTARPVLTGHFGQEPSDPALVAQAILTAIAAPEPPLVLLLGTDALGYVKGEFAMLQAQFNTWAHLTNGVAAAET